MNAAPRGLIDAASAYYRAANPFARRFARAKLATDPFYAAILAHGLLRGRARILDLGCGQGLLAAWLLAARAWGARERDAWPRGWPAPPEPLSYCGIEINPHEVARARRAFALDPGIGLTIVHGDVRDVDYPPADAIVILDVLHYLDPAGQARVLERACRTLPRAGMLLLRVKDAAAGARYLASRTLDQAVALARRRRWLRLHCRSLDDWIALLARCGLRSEVQPLGATAALADVLVCAVPA